MIVKERINPIMYFYEVIEDAYIRLVFNVYCLDGPRALA